MADQKAPQMQATLGLTGLTSNAMALIAPGAFLWLTFFIQATTGVAGQPSTAPGHVDRHLRRASAVSGDSCGLRRDLQALSRHRIELLLRGAGAAVEGQGVQVCAYREVHRRLGLSPLLLGVSRRDGGDHRHLCRIRGRLPVSRTSSAARTPDQCSWRWWQSCSHSSLRGSHRRARALRRR